MKRMLCLCLAVILVLGMTACGKKTEKKFEDGVLYAGFGRADITPEVSTPLGGYDSTDMRMSNRVLDSLLATCIAFTEGEETFLLFAVDAIRSKQDWTDAVREKITAELGIPAENVLIASSHTHSSPNNGSSHAAIALYKEIYINGCLEAAEAAMKDRAKATMSSGSVMTENMTFVRHYLMNDGTVSGSNFGSSVSGYAGHVGRNDPEMILVNLEREGKKDILMMNFQSHTTMTGGATVLDISSDYVGICRDLVEEQADVHFAFFLGAAGNQTPGSNIGQENNVMPYADKLSSQDRTYVTYGTALAYYALDLLPNLTQIDSGTGIKTTSEVVTVNTNKAAATSDRVNDAQLVLDEWESKDRAAGNAMASKLGFQSVYEARGIINAQNLPDTRNIEVWATRIGGLTFVNAPYEMFSENGLYIKENIPEGEGQETMVITMTNASWGYITDMKAHEYSCYENFSFSFAPGTGETLAEKMVELAAAVQ